MWEYPIARAFADARMSRIGGGAVEVMKQIIANSLLPKQAKMERREPLSEDL
jgi:acyl-CoA dehydrogenase